MDTANTSPQKVISLENIQHFINKLSNLPSDLECRQIIDFRLDCFIRVLEITGKLLESLDKPYTDTIIEQIDKLTKLEGLLSSRIYFLLLGVMESRQNEWTPRLESLKPVTIEEIRKKVEREIERRNKEISFWRKHRKAST